MSNESAYSTAFSESDAIQVGSSWRIENGRHRSLTLKCLGTTFVEKSGMDNWITVKKED
jgi:hypothetical protein